MATYAPDNTIFSKIASEIIHSFGWLMEQATKRRDQLLTELNELRNQFKERVGTQEAALKELERMRANLLDMSIKQNVLKDVKEESLSPVEKQIKEFSQKSISEPLLRFDCALTEMLHKMSTLGAIVEEEQKPTQQNTNLIQSDQINYSERVTAVRRIGREGTGEGEFKYPLSMHITDNDYLYVVERENKRVQVLDPESGTFLSQFGSSSLVEPNGVYANDLFCYVTDNSLHTLLQFSVENYELVKKSSPTGGTHKNLNNPAGLTGSDHVLYVADNRNDRVCVFDLYELEFLSEVGVGTLKNPCDVKVSCDEIYVLDNSPQYLHTFDKSGNSLRSILNSLCAEGKIFDPASFCIDNNRNIIVTDVQSQTLKIFSQEGKLLHCIGEVPGTEAVGECYGVILFRNTIFVSCSYPYHCVKVF